MIRANFFSLHSFEQWHQNRTIPEKDGYTPMHGAGFQGRRSIAELLKKHGVGLRDKHADGHEPASELCREVSIVAVSPSCLSSNSSLKSDPLHTNEFS
jgi:hypothetical protein